ncbi:3-ketodihydrosphingosine reductase isoform X1 [Diorhabda sublineata]|uniref:3-ketodihydrosphingosine reductase isoform X1 n=1 Tax=Diorhabda sublineata TaxID=1163346 RepID=UPI0024E0C351|nr:3-ketodihydrosphingosine reductase isoform X1 [Diorhabda sublineata]
MLFIWLCIIFVPCILIPVVVYLRSLPKKSVNGKHVVVIGGSSGIGKSVAIVAAKEGANVTIIARNVEKLNYAQKEIESYKCCKEQIISKISVDICDYESLEQNFSKIETIVGPIFMMVNCAGMAICGEVEKFTLDEIKQLVDINFLGSLYSVKAIVPKFKMRKEGIIVLTGSQVTLMGMYGYSVYSSCKFALRGLAESLYMEVKPYNISVTLALPPDTDTPGFANENKTKPTETKLISDTAGLATPEKVAKKLVNDALTGKFFSYVGFESYMVTTLCTGMSPFSTFLDVIMEATVLGLLRIISAFYIISFNNIVKKCHENKTKKIM